MTEAVKAKTLSLVGQGYIYGARGQICSKAFREQQARQYPEQADKILGTGAKWDGVPVWDCAQLTREVCKQAGVSLVSGATSQWTKTAWNDRGEIDTIPEHELVLVYRQSSANAAKMQHTGVALGDGTCVHARGTAYGVVRQQMHEYAWTHWARPEWSAGQAQTTDRPTVKRGAIGAHVTAMQLLLLDAGYRLRKYGADGDFGAETEEALKAYQLAHGLAADGICGPKTWAQLEKEKETAQPRIYTVTISGLTKEEAEEIAEEHSGVITEGGAANGVR